jgi:hypothetical protein
MYIILRKRGYPALIFNVFDVGDGRQNEVPHLGSLHLLFVRYHNHIAEKLAQLNPDWDDEKLYQETRSIVSAIFQHIIYNEYLPHVLGQDIMDKFNLFSKDQGFDTVYDKKMDASTRNVIGSAVLRYGHSQVGNFERDFNKKFKPTESRKIEDTFFHPHMCVRRNGTGYDGVLRWQLSERSARLDGYVTELLVR